MTSLIDEGDKNSQHWQRREQISHLSELQAADQRHFVHWSFVGWWSNVASDVLNSLFAGCTFGFHCFRTESPPCLVYQGLRLHVCSGACWLTLLSHGITSSLDRLGWFFHANNIICFVVLFSFQRGLKDCAQAFVWLWHFR